MKESFRTRFYEASVSMSIIHGYIHNIVNIKSKVNICTLTFNKKLCISIHYFFHTTSLNLTFSFLIYHRFSVQKGGGDEFSFLFPASYNTWIHVAMIYKGPTDGQGISIYKDGLHVGDDDQQHTYQDGPLTILED